MSDAATRRRMARLIHGDCLAVMRRLPLALRRLCGNNHD